MKNLLFILMTLSACGDSIVATETTSCISGSFNSVSSPDTRVNFATHDLFTLSAEGCQTSGTYTCTEPGKFQVTIDSTEDASSALCQSTGKWNCSYAYTSSEVIVACLGDGPNNVLDPAVPFSLYW